MPLFGILPKRWHGSRTGRVGSGSVPSRPSAFTFNHLGSSGAPGKGAGAPRAHGPRISEYEEVDVALRITHEGGPGERLHPFTHKQRRVEPKGFFP